MNDKQTLLLGMAIQSGMTAVLAKSGIISSMWMHQALACLMFTVLMLGMWYFKKFAQEK